MKRWGVIPVGRSSGVTDYPFPLEAREAIWAALPAVRGGRLAQARVDVPELGLSYVLRHAPGGQAVGGRRCGYSVAVIPLPSERAGRPRHAPRWLLLGVVPLSCLCGLVCRQVVHEARRRGAEPSPEFAWAAALRTQPDGAAPTHALPPNQRSTTRPRVARERVERQRASDEPPPGLAIPAPTSQTTLEARAETPLDAPATAEVHRTTDAPRASPNRPDQRERVTCPPRHVREVDAQRRVAEADPGQRKQVSCPQRREERGDAQRRTGEPRSGQREPVTCPQRREREADPQRRAAEARPPVTGDQGPRPRALHRQRRVG